MCDGRDGHRGHERPIVQLCMCYSRLMMSIGIVGLIKSKFVVVGRRGWCCGRLMLVLMLVMGKWLMLVLILMRVFMFLLELFWLVLLSVIVLVLVFMGKSVLLFYWLLGEVLRFC